MSTVRAAAWMVGSAAIAKAKLIRMVDVLAVVKGADVVGIVEGIGEDYIPPLLDFPIISHAYAISDKEALDTCNIVLKKEGVLSGSSSGTLIAAAIKYCKEQMKFIKR